MHRSVSTWRPRRLSDRRPGLAALDGVALGGHRLPAVRAVLLARTGDTAAALRHYDAAIALCRNAAERAHLVEARDRLD